MRYLLLIYNCKRPEPTDPGFPEALARVNAFADECRRRGVLVGGDALQAEHTATTVSVRDGRTLITDGPFVETHEHLGGYYAAAVDTPEHRQLRAEAIRLGKLIATLMPDEPEAVGLVALLLLHDSRAAARYTAAGDVVLLEDQDRDRWDRAQIAEAVGLLDRALRRGAVGPYQLQAAIAALHAQAPSTAETDWPRIAALYGELLAVAPSPVVALNHAVAVAMTGGPGGGPAAGLALIDRIDGLDRYHLLHAARADLLRRLGRTGEAAAAYRRAHELATNPADRRFLAGRLRDLDPPAAGQAGTGCQATRPR